MPSELLSVKTEEFKSYIYIHTHTYIYNEKPLYILEINGLNLNHI